MPRNPDGSVDQALPPVVPGGVVESAWANTSFTDFTQIMSDSLSRTGQGSMSAPLLSTDGNAAAPGIAFVSEANTGFHRPDAGDLYLSVLGVDLMRFTDDNGVQIHNGVEWLSVLYGATTYDDITAAITINAGNISDNTAAIVLLDGRVDALEAGPLDPLVSANFKSSGPIRHILDDQGAGNSNIDVGAFNRHFVDNAGALTLTFIGMPSGADAELGADFQEEGQIVIWNGGSPGTVALSIAGTVRTIGSQTTNANEAQVLTYIIQRRSGANFTTLIWSAIQ